MLRKRKKKYKGVPISGFGPHFKLVGRNMRGLQAMEKLGKEDVVPDKREQEGGEKELPKKMGGWGWGGRLGVGGWGRGGWGGLKGKGV